MWATSRPNNKDQSKMIWMDVLKPNPRKIPGLGPIVSYTQRALIVCSLKKIKVKRFERTFWNQFWKRIREKQFVTLYELLYTISTNCVFIKKIKVKRFEWTFEVKFTRYNPRIISYKRGSNHVFYWIDLMQPQIFEDLFRIFRSF